MRRRYPQAAETQLVMERMPCSWCNYGARKLQRVYVGPKETFLCGRCTSRMMGAIGFIERIGLGIDSIKPRLIAEREWLAGHPVPRLSDYASLPNSEERHLEALKDWAEWYEEEPWLRG